MLIAKIQNKIKQIYAPGQFWPLKILLIVSRTKCETLPENMEAGEQNEDVSKIEKSEAEQYEELTGRHLQGQNHMTWLGRTQNLGAAEPACL